jgi:predicted ATPase
MIHKLAIENYRSILKLVVSLSEINLVTGPNGSGKSNLYRALRLLAETSQGRIISSLAAEGGFQSTLWAGPEKFSRGMLSGEVPIQGTVRKKPVNLKLGFVSEEFGYAIDLGLPSSGSSMFSRDPEIKRECIWWGEKLRPSCLFADRRRCVVSVRGADDEWAIALDNIPGYESMMTYCSDPRTTPEILRLRETMRAWRFYDTLRTDPQAPARTPQVGTYSPVLDDTGSNLAAAVQTIREVGNRRAFDDAISDAFPRAEVGVEDISGWFELTMTQHGILRPFKAAELSEGTLRYILLVAALLTPRPPALMVLNEPESSLHPDLFPALGRLIVRASKKSQIIIVSHAKTLIEALEETPGCNVLRLEKEAGATRINGADRIGQPRWEWPSR